MTTLLLAAISFALSQTDSPIIAPGAKLEKLGGGYAFTEGPVDDKDGNVYFTDQPNDRILKWTTDGKVSVWMQPCGRANGMAIDKSGNLIACADENNELWSISPTHQVRVLVKEFRGKLLNGPNDVWIRPDDGMYVTDPLYSRPYWKRNPDSQQTGNHVYFLPAGRHKFLQVTDDLKTPNGIVGTPDGKMLYVADLGLNATFQYLIQPDGTLKNKQLFCHLGSDGMTLDELGNVYLSGKGVTVFDRYGHQVEHIDVPEDWVGHVCFGGKDKHMLFITASKGIYGIKTKARGAY